MDKKIKRHAKILLAYSGKVLNYRKHAMSVQIFSEISALRSSLKVAIGGGDGSAADRVSKNLEAMLTSHGGDTYPVKFSSDNCEALLVASIIAVALRAFFIQPFQIPTNSMLPTYYGVTSCVHSAEVKEPSAAEKFLGKIFRGPTNFCIKSNYSGNLEIPIFRGRGTLGSRDGMVKFCYRPGRTCLGLIPTTRRVYELKIGDSCQEICVPGDCSLDEVLLEKFGEGHKSWQEACDAFPSKFKITGDAAWFCPGVRIEPGQRIINFDRICGDVLFVNKVAYHFRRPKIGDAVVFRTEKIKDLPGEPRYFIKRLVGRGGDSIQLIGKGLRRNGKKIQGSEIFEWESNGENGYRGYTAVGSLANGGIVRVNGGEYFVLGDNSGNSGDSRFWGFVPEEEVVGKPMFVFYPLNRARLCK